MIGNQLHTLSYLKRVTGLRSQMHQCAHVLSLAPYDAAALAGAVNANGLPFGAEGRYLRHDMRQWRPRDGWVISRADQQWLDIPNGYVVVHRSEAVQ